MMWLFYHGVKPVCRTRCLCRLTQNFALDRRKEVPGVRHMSQYSVKIRDENVAYFSGASS